MIAWLYVLVGLAVIGALAYLFWSRISPWVKDSETIFLARLWEGLGGILIVLAAADYTPLFVALGIPQWSGVAVLFLGVITNLARRNRADL